MGNYRGENDFCTQSWAYKVRGKKDLSLKHPDQIIEAEMREINQHPDSPDYSSDTRSGQMGIGPKQTVIGKSSYYMNGAFVEDFKDVSPGMQYPTSFSQMHQSMSNTFGECFTTSLKKSNDYSKGDNTYRNFEGSVRIGISVQKGILLRMQDKFVRLENLLENDTPKVAESIEDTLMDLINYAAILKARREYEAAL